MAIAFYTVFYLVPFVIIPVFLQKSEYQYTIRTNISLETTIDETGLVSTPQLPVSDVLRVYNTAMDDVGLGFLSIFDWLGQFIDWILSWIFITYQHEGKMIAFIKLRPAYSLSLILIRRVMDLYG